MTKIENVSIFSTLFARLEGNLRNNNLKVKTMLGRIRDICRHHNNYRIKHHW